MKHDTGLSQIAIHWCLQQGDYGNISLPVNENFSHSSMNTHGTQSHYDWCFSLDAKVAVQHTSELLVPTEPEIS